MVAIPMLIPTTVSSVRVRCRHTFLKTRVANLMDALLPEVLLVPDPDRPVSSAQAPLWWPGVARRGVSAVALASAAGAYR